MISQQLFLSWKAPPLRVLPRRPAPLLDETLNSYLSRLARANHLATSSLRELLSGSKLQSVPVPAERLAQLTGYPRQSLCYAVLDLCTPGELRHMRLDQRPLPGQAHQCRSFCRLCLLRHGLEPQDDAPVRWHHPEDVICWHHRRWIPFNGDSSAPQPPVDRVEPIRQANRLHRRLRRRYGHNAVMTAFRDADYIVTRWARAGRHQRRFRHLMVQLAGEDWREATGEASPARAAARYPDVVALTRLLVAPAWRAMALPKREGLALGIEPALLAEIRRTVARHYGRTGPDWNEWRHDPLYLWIENERKNATMLLRGAKTATKKDTWFPGLAAVP